MRRNFPRTYTTTYLRVVVVGQLVALADSEITAFLPVVLTGFVTVSFHSIRVAVSFAAVSDQLGPCLRSSQPCLPMLHHFLAYLPGFASARPLAFVSGAGLEPATKDFSIIVFRLNPPMLSSTFF